MDRVCNHMITKFDITHFRGIESLTIEDISQLNVFLGYNNCGKSSVLEALYLFCDPSHPVNNMQINRARHYLKMDASALPLNFYDLDTSTPIVFEGVLDDNEKRKLSIDYITQDFDKADLSDLTLTNLKDDKLYGISWIMLIGIWIMNTCCHWLNSLITQYNIFARCRIISKLSCS